MNRINPINATNVINTQSFILIALIFSLTTTACAQTAPQPPVDLSPYQSNKLYCENDSDCAIRESACVDEPMNIFFDNSKLIEMRPYVNCLTGVIYVNPRCEEGKCAADLMQEEPRVVCTMDVKQCSDGSYVGPKCEFAKCPQENESYDHNLE